MQASPTRKVAPLTNQHSPGLDVHAAPLETMKHLPSKDLELGTS
jgi:hypothetical protein